MRTRSRIPLILCLSVAALSAQTATPTRPTHGKRYARLAIRNAMIVDGNGTPASGPKDIIIENNTIAAIMPFDPVASQGGRRRRGGNDSLGRHQLRYAQYRALVRNPGCSDSGPGTGLSFK